jgi:hypothetical protein
MKITGCWAKLVPTVAVADGWVAIASALAAAGLTVVTELVLGVIPPVVTSDAVTVRLPEVLRVTLKILVPLTNAALAGNVALASLEVIPTVSVTVLITFQFESTALTVTLKAVPAVRAVGVPVLPVGVLGAAVSPGIRTCKLEKLPALTVIAGLVLAVIPAFVTSEAVTVRLPAVLSVTMNVCVPPLSAAFAGKVAIASLEVIRTVSVIVATRFQFVSTALTVTEKAVPAVCAASVPVLPVVVPGAAVSPGTNSCSLATRPGFTVRLELGTPVNPLAVAVINVVSAFLSVVVRVVVD